MQAVFICLHVWKGRLFMEEEKKIVQVKFSPVQADRILAGQNVLITGGGGGIGSAMARKFTSVGASVILVDNKPEKMEKVKTELAGYPVFTMTYDVTDTKDMPELFADAEKISGKEVTILCANAGISLHEHGITEVTREKFDLQIAVNLRAPFFLTKAFLERYEKNARGRKILITTSEAADEGFDRPYGMTKAGLNNMIKAISHRVYEKGMRINGIAPGVTITDMTRDNISSTEQNLAYEGVAGRVMVPEEIAEVACFLISDASTCISGEIIHCNASAHVRSYYKA